MPHFRGDGNACACGPGGHIPGSFGSRKRRNKALRVVGLPEIPRERRNKVARWLPRMRADKCHYCGGAGGTIDHIIPRSKGGKSTKGNCVPACAPCNNFRGIRDYTEFKAGGWKERPFAGTPDDVKRPSDTWDGWCPLCGERSQPKARHVNSLMKQRHVTYCCPACMGKFRVEVIKS